jgi:predicted ferric reductase
MSHDHMSMSMGMEGVPSLYQFPKFYWAAVGSAVGVAALVNLYNHVLCRQRLSAAQAGAQYPAKPKSWIALGTATMFALTREASGFSLHIPLKKQVLRLPSVGRVSLVLANIITLVVLCLYGLDLVDPFGKEDVAFRCGVMTLAQIPLIFLLAGKNNIIGHLSGVSYEKLNWLHRWCARCMLLTATMHLGYFFTSWARYDYIGWKLQNDPLAWKGLAAWSTLIWIVFSSATPIRGWCYEFFVVQHLVSFAVLIGFVYVHIPIVRRGYVIAPIVLFFLDRGLRALQVLYTNVSLFHPKQRQQGQTGSFLACKAEFTPLPHNTTRVVIRNPPISWTPGQHMFLSCHSVVPLQSHPFTVASIPEDGVMEFLIKSESGGTRRFLRHAEKTHGQSNTSIQGKTVTIEGPYGCIRPLRQFDSVVFFAGSTGATFTLPLLRDIVQGWRENTTPTTTKKSSFSVLGRQPGAATRQVHFVWVVKSRAQFSWFSDNLSSISTEVERLQDTLRDIKLEVSVYITCDESLTEGHNSLLAPMTAANHATKTPQQAEHGTVQYRDRPASGDEALLPAKQKEPIHALTPTSSSSSSHSSNPPKPCCCRSAVSETKPAPPCLCAQTARPPSLQSLSPAVSLKHTHAGLAMYTGRPSTRAIMRRALEAARGESAVVVCGPVALVSDVQRDVCALSDERAVHKGTGAQGVYVHAESYGY